MPEKTMNGCHNRPPYRPYYYGRDGYYSEGILRFKLVPHKMTKDCQYSKDTDDPRCAGCKWKAPK